MQPSTKITLKIKRDQNGTTGSTLPDLLESTNQTPADLSSSDEEEDQLNENAHKQLVIYDPSTNSAEQVEPVPDLNEFQMVPTPKKSTPSQSNKQLPSVGTYTVQCAKCFKWRLIPTSDKYEEIRERILENPFDCETAREWKPDISCEDEPDIKQDGSRLWAIDRPNIAKPPPGWQRLLRIRGYGASKFADVYYVAPATGKKLRSMIEVQKYLEQHPELGVRLAQFSFQTPKPLQEDYVKKRPAKSASDPNNGSTGLLVNPISWATPDENTELQLAAPPGLSEPISRPKKRSKKLSADSTSGFVAFDDQLKVQVDESSQVATGDEPSDAVNMDEVSQPKSGDVDVDVDDGVE